MKFYELSIINVFWRLYALMAIVLIAGFSGQWWLAAFVPILFLSTLLGMSFRRNAMPDSETQVQISKLVTLRGPEDLVVPNAKPAPEAATLAHAA